MSVYAVASLAAGLLLVGLGALLAAGVFNVARQTFEPEETQGRRLAVLGVALIVVSVLAASGVMP